MHLSITLPLHNISEGHNKKPLVVTNKSSMGFIPLSKVNYLLSLAFNKLVRYVTISEKIISDDFIHSYTTIWTTALFMIDKTMPSLQNSAPQVVQAQSDILREMQLAG